MSYAITVKAYSKLVLHSCKYPHASVNGLLIGSISKKDQSVQIQDSIPLFHMELGLAPMLEIALTQVELYCGTKGLSIVGYYHANEALQDSSVSDTAQCIASKVASECEKACLLMVDNEKLTREDVHALKLFVRKDGGGGGSVHWKEQGNLRLIDSELTLKVTNTLVKNKLFEQVVDFDNHLDDLQLDWTNPAIGRAIDDSDLKLTD